MPGGTPGSGASPALPDARLATPECRPLEGRRIKSRLTEHRFDCLLPRDKLCRHPGQAIKPLLKLLHPALLTRLAAPTRQPTLQE